MSENDSSEENGDVIVEPIDDPEGYVQQRRLKDIFDARKKVRDRRLKTKQHQIENQHKQESIDAVRMYRTAVENYLSELRPLFHEDDLGQHYWYNQEVGIIDVSLPVVEKPSGRRGTIYKYGDMRIAQRPSPKEISLEGIGCLFQLPSPLVVTFDVTEKTGNAGLGTAQSNQTTVNHKTTVPFTHLDRIMNLANRYLSERGMELDPEKETDPAQI